MGNARMCDWKAAAHNAAACIDHHVWLRLSLHRGTVVQERQAGTYSGQKKGNNTNSWVNLT